MISRPMIQMPRSMYVEMRSERETLRVCVADLLAACEAVLTAWDSDGPQEDVAVAVARMRAAVRKAKGEDNAE